MASLGPQICLSKLLEQTRISVTQLHGAQVYCRKASSSSELFSRGQSPSRNIGEKQNQGTNDQSTMMQKTKSSDTFDKLRSGVSSGVIGIMNTVHSIGVPNALKNISIPSLSSLPYGKKDAKKHDLQESKRKTVKFKEDVTISREHHSLSQHIEEANEGIKSFYDTTLVNTKAVNNNAESKNNNAQEDTSRKIPDTVQVLAKKSDNIKDLEKKNSDASYWEMLSKLTVRSKAKNSMVEVAKKPKKTELNNRTVDLVINVKKATSAESMLKRLSDLCSHLKQYPDCRSIAVKNQVQQDLIRLTQSRHDSVRSQAHEALALVGYVAPPRGRGIKMLSVDGGGTKGLVAIEMLKMLERALKAPLHTMFDYVIGTSTGSLVVILAFMFQLPLEACENLYLEKSREMFTRSRVSGSARLAWDYAYYDSTKFEKILRDLMGEKYMTEFAKNPNVPKMSAVSTLVNIAKWKNFLFRNYNLPSGVYSDYPGNCKQKVWEVVMASSAAPAFYKEKVLEEYIFRDGGLIANNPTAIGIHECKLLWPGESIQCVVSIGTGRYEPHPVLADNKWVLPDIIQNITETATDTESVHMTLKDHLPPSAYYRFNPYLAESFLLDEIRPEKIRQMQLNAQMYCQKNEAKLQKAVDQLKLTRLPHQKLQDFFNHQRKIMS